jgi:hypothetical protein
MGHTHIGGYYHRFRIHMESEECQCSAALQTRHHILLDCPLLRKHRHLLRPTGSLRLTPYEKLMGCHKDIARLVKFLKASQAMDKRPNTCNRPTPP